MNSPTNSTKHWEDYSTQDKQHILEGMEAFLNEQIILVDRLEGTLAKQCLQNSSFGKNKREFTKFQKRLEALKWKGMVLTILKGKLKQCGLQGETL